MDLSKHLLCAESAEPARYLVPEKRLLCAMIERSYLDLKSRDKKIVHYAAAWFRSKSKEPFSFWWVCNHLGLDWPGLRGFILAPLLREADSCVVIQTESLLRILP